MLLNYNDSSQIRFLLTGQLKSEMMSFDGITVGETIEWNFYLKIYNT
ncbi:hypothetical protein PL9214650568 [Planktothrix tepida PCC 9214]|uniref:Uncharacterized protein n=1 Tax=Planktothrix tepida PCC 9214 TaxID=671072 RepID=A0A1J1LUA3_9CYAN|nr:hypothetical protein PL9214650568 [Planktothrix tepida PCC 9214]